MTHLKSADFRRKALVQELGTFLIRERAWFDEGSSQSIRLSTLRILRQWRLFY